MIICFVLIDKEILFLFNEYKVVKIGLETMNLSFEKSGLSKQSLTSKNIDEGIFLFISSGMIEEQLI